MYPKHIKNLTNTANFKNMLAVGRDDLFYLTGMDIDGYWLFIAKGKAIAFAPDLLAQHLRTEMPWLEVKQCKSVLECFKAFCREMKVSRLGVNPANLSLSVARELEKKVRLDDAGEILGGLRQVKDALEIENIRISCKIASLAMRYAFSLLKNRMSENEIAFKIEEFFAKNGTRPAFLPIVASGPNSAWPHHVSSSRIISPDDVVLIDLGCTYKGYCSDLTRTFFLGKINKLRKKVNGLVRKAHDTALQDIRPGKTATEIDRAARDIISGGGYGDFFIHTTGHGLGVTVHEPPRISSINQSKLKAGMVITVEPGIYLPGEFGVRIEDTVLITNKGREVLTS